MTVAEQTRVFLSMVLRGAGIGAVHDLLAVIRRGALLTMAADMLLGFVAAAGVISAALLLRCDAFRLYTLLGVAVGWMIYAFSMGTIVRALTKSFIGLSKKVKNKA